jgi:hypothetical protein
MHERSDWILRNVLSAGNAGEAAFFARDNTPHYHKRISLTRQQILFG